MRSNSRRRLRITSITLLMPGARRRRVRRRRRRRRRPPRTAAPPRRRRPAPRTEPGGRRRRRPRGTVAAAQEEGSVTDLLEPGPRPAQRPGRRLRGGVRHLRRGRARPSTATSSPGSRPSCRTNTSGGDLVVIAAQAFMETHADGRRLRRPDGQPAARRSRRLRRRRSTSTTATSSRSAPPSSRSPGTPTWCPTGLTDYPDLLDPVAGRRQDRRARPGHRPGARRLLPLARGGVRRGLRRPSWPPRSPGSTRARCRSVRRSQSGEIFAGAFAAPVQLVPAARAVRPGRLRDLRGRRRLGRPLLRRASRRRSDSPNAAALLADFMVTAEGQEIVQGASGSVLPDIPGTLITNDRVRIRTSRPPRPSPPRPTSRSGTACSADRRPTVTRAPLRRGPRRVEGSGRPAVSA